MEPGCTQQMLFWTFCVTVLTHVSSQTDFLIVSHGHNWPLNSPDLNPCDYFLWGIPQGKDFSKKASNNNGIESIDHSGPQRDNWGMCRRVTNNITVRVEEVARHNCGHIEHLIHRG
jgi:hypothetical protein